MHSRKIVSQKRKSILRLRETVKYELLWTPGEKYVKGCERGWGRGGRWQENKIFQADVAGWALEVAKKACLEQPVAFESLVCVSRSCRHLPVLCLSQWFSHFGSSFRFCANFLPFSLVRLSFQDVGPEEK